MNSRRQQTPNCLIDSRPNHNCTIVPVKTIQGNRQDNAKGDKYSAVGTPSTDQSTIVSGGIFFLVSVIYYHFTSVTEQP